ncbi:hypothetical protein BC830DRAFT_1118787 [Chytriomyces sp. MP71]|nr:hypothetical protein BC830DRAFT_1118787 [Chytriomyces sp. MP71]
MFIASTWKANSTMGVTPATLLGRKLAVLAVVGMELGVLVPPGLDLVGELGLCLLAVLLAMVLLLRGNTRSKTRVKVIKDQSKAWPSKGNRCLP